MAECVLLSPWDSCLAQKIKKNKSNKWHKIIIQSNANLNFNCLLTLKNLTLIS